MKIKRILCVLLAVVCAFSVAACGGGSGSGSDKVRIVVWEDESNIDMLQPLATQFISSYRQAYPKAPLIEIVFEHQAEGSAMENLGQYGPVGLGADILAFIHDTVGTGANSGDLSKVLYEAELKNNLTEEAVGAFTINNSMYGYPITAESITLMYDKSKVSADKLASFEAIKENNLKIAMKSTGEGSAYYGFALLSDSVLFGEKGNEATNVNLATEKAIANSVEFYSKYTQSLADVMPEEAITLLQSGEVAAIMSTPFLWSAVKNALGDNAAVTVLPTLGGETLRPFSGYKGYGVSSYSQNPHIAHAFANYLVSKDAQKLRFIQKQYLPTLKDTTELDTLVSQDSTGKYQFVEVFTEQLNNSFTMPSILAMGNYWIPMQSVHTAMYQKGASIDTAFVTSQLTTAKTTILK